MPDRAPHCCAVPGCPALTTRRHCPTHAAAAEQARPNWTTRRWYRTPRWQAVRARVLLAAAFTCAACGHVQAALKVDHRTKHDGDLARFWDPANLQPLCRRCHQQKTSRGE